MNCNAAFSGHQSAQQILQGINLPSETEELVHIFETHPNHLTRVCALAKIKNQILCALQEQQTTTPSDSISHKVEQLFSGAVIKVIKKLRVLTKEDKTETTLFYHVVGLAIKYYFRQQAFNSLIIEVTDLLDGHNTRIKPALQLFTQIIATIEFSGAESRNNLPRCRFQRHLTSIHLNSMLLLANFCIERSILKEGFSLEDAPSDQMFDMRAPEDTILAAFRLLRMTLCFDWLGEKFNDFQQVWDFSTLVIPTKGTKQSSLTQFEKWLRNSDWMRGYQYIYRHCKMMTLKLEVLEVMGDMARIHMKFFKNKNNFKIHIQNIVFGFIGIIQHLQLSRNCQESIQLSLAMGCNLNKLTISGSGSILFQINTNFFRALLGSVKKFITEQIIGQQIFNTNLIYYFFKFAQALLVKSRYEKIQSNFQQIQQKIRQICRNYEHYIRTLFNKIAKSPIKNGQSSFYRFDCSRLKDNISLYECKQLQIFFMPFRLMKPRYASTITIQQLFVYIIARVTRALSLISMFKLQDWQKQLAYSIIAQSIQKINEWFDYTSYRRKVLNKQRLSKGRSLSEDNLPSIRQLYQEEIQNQEEYCHMLRLISFILIDQFNQQKSVFFLKIGGVVLKMIALTVQMCYGADLLQKDNKELKNRQIYNKIQNSMEMCLQVCQKILRRQYEKFLMFHLNSNNLKIPIRYRFQFNQNQICFPDSCYHSQKAALFELVDKYIRQKNPPFKITLTKLYFLLASSYTDLDVQRIFQIHQNKLPIYLIYLQNLACNPTLTVLLQLAFPPLIQTIRNILQSLGSHEYSSQQLVNYLQCLRLVVRLNLQDFSEEAMNKLYVSMKYLLPFLGSQLQITEGLAEQLQKLKKQLFLVNTQQDIIQLGHDISRILTLYYTKQQEKDLQVIIYSKKKNDQYQTYSQKDTNKNTLEQSYQTCLIPANSLAQNQSVHLQNNDHPKIIEQIDNQIYNGSHRQKTLKILGKYIQQQVVINQQQKISNSQKKSDSQSYQQYRNKQNTQNIESDEFQILDGNQEIKTSSFQNNNLNIHQNQVQIQFQDKQQTNQRIDNQQKEQNQKQIVYMQIQQPKQLFGIKTCINQIQNLQFQKQHHIEHISPPKHNSVETLKEIEQNIIVDQNNQDDFYIPFVTEEQERQKQMIDQKSEFQGIHCESPFRKEKILLYNQLPLQSNNMQENNIQKQQFILSDISKVDQRDKQLDDQIVNQPQQMAIESMNRTESSQRVVITKGREKTENTQLMIISNEAQAKEEQVLSKVKVKEFNHNQQRSIEKRTLMLSQSSSESQKRKDQQIS